MNKWGLIDKDPNDQGRMPAKTCSFILLRASSSESQQQDLQLVLTSDSSDSLTPCSLDSLDTKSQTVLISSFSESLDSFDFLNGMHTKVQLSNSAILLFSPHMKKSWNLLIYSGNSLYLWIWSWVKQLMGWRSLQLVNNLSHCIQSVSVLLLKCTL